MDLGSVRALALDVNFSVHGVPAVVTLPLGDPVDARVLWLTPLAESNPGGTDLQKREMRRVAALRRSEVPEVPRGTRIVAPEKAGDDDQGWLVDATERVEADHTRVVVMVDPTWVAEDEDS